MLRVFLSKKSRLSQISSAYSLRYGRHTLHKVKAQSCLDSETNTKVSQQRRNSIELTLSSKDRLKRKLMTTLIFKHTQHCLEFHALNSCGQKSVNFFYILRSHHCLFIVTNSLCQHCESHRAANTFKRRRDLQSCTLCLCPES